jgi:hypothetical protein
MRSADWSFLPAQCPGGNFPDRLGQELGIAILGQFVFGQEQHAARGLAARQRFWRERSDLRFVQRLALMQGDAPHHQFAEGFVRNADGPGLLYGPVSSSRASTSTDETLVLL